MKIVAVSDILEVQSIRDSDKLAAFWNRRYRETYLDLLEGVSEIGRHGVLAEMLMRLVHKGRVLDVGCGTGILSSLIDLECFEYVGVDIASEPLALAQSKHARRRVSFVRSALEDFSPAEPFSAIVFNEILYYIDLGRALTLATQWTHGVGWVLASVFDFPKGREVIETLHKNVDVRSSCSVRNELDSLVWNVVAGRLVSIGHPC